MVLAAELLARNVEVGTPSPLEVQLDPCAARARSRGRRPLFEIGFRVFCVFSFMSNRNRVSTPPTLHYGLGDVIPFKGVVIVTQPEQVVNIHIYHHLALNHRSNQLRECENAIHGYSHPEVEDQRRYIHPHASFLSCPPKPHMQAPDPSNKIPIRLQLNLDARISQIRLLPCQ